MLTSGFDDCGTIFSGTKLIDLFGEMLERDFVQADLEVKHLELVRTYADDLKEVQELFSRDRYGSDSVGKFFEREGPPLYVNMPPVSGALAWVKGFIRRVEDPVRSLAGIMRLLEETDEVKDVRRMYDSILESLQSYEGLNFDAWKDTVDGTLNEKLTLPLITRHPGTFEVSVNFDPKLIRLLNECKYFVIQKKAIPDIAQLLYEQAEIYRVQTANLTLIKNMYNEMLRTMIEVEKPLLKGLMKAIDKVLDRGLKELVWKSPNPDKDAFIAEAHGLVVDAYKTLAEMKANMKVIHGILAKWTTAPLITRQSTNKTYNLAAYMEEHVKFLEGRQKDVTDGGKEIHSQLKNSNEVLKVSKGAPAWRAYVEYVNHILVSGLADTVVESLGFLLAQIDPSEIGKGDKSPFFDVKLNLNPHSHGDHAVFFSPPLDGAPHMVDGAPIKNDPNLSITYIIASIISDFYNIVSFVKRLDRAEGDFRKEMEEQEPVRFHVHRIVDEMEKNREACLEFRRPFLKHKNLWCKDIQVTLEHFLETAMDEMKTADGEAMEGAPSMPSLSQFQLKIQELRDEEADIKEITNIKTEGWLKIDAKPIKGTLGKIASQWSETHTSYLKDYVDKELSQLQEFIKGVSAGLASEVEENDQEKLIEAMTFVRDVRLSQDRIDNLFVPLKGIIGLLKTFKISMPDETVELLEMIPFNWEDTKKVTLNAREFLGPLQSLQQEKVRAATHSLSAAAYARARCTHPRAHPPPGALQRPPAL